MVRVFQNQNFNSLSTSLQFGNNSAQLSQSQTQKDGLLESARHQASDWRSLAAMSIGSTAFTLTRSVSHALLANFFRSSSLLSGASWSTALVCEVAAFRASNQALSEAGHTESWSDGRAFLGTTLDFILLKGFSHYLHGESFITRHGVSASAMVAGELARESTGLSDATQKDLSDRFIHAAVTSVALEIGSQVSQRATGGRLHAFERNMKGHLESQLSGHAERQPQDSPYETGERLFAMRSSGPLSERRFQIEGRNIVLRIEGEVSEGRAQELEGQIAQALQGELVLELEGIVTEERFSKNQAKIFTFMSGRETQITVTSSGEVRNIRITKDGREVFRLGETAASSTAHPAAPAARVSAAEATRPVVLAEPVRVTEAERPAERVEARLIERTEDPAWARQELNEFLDSDQGRSFAFSVRLSNQLRDANIRTLGQLLRLSEIELLSPQAAKTRGGSDGIGRKTLKELKDRLAKNNLALAMADAEIAAIPDLSTPREVTQGSDGKRTVRVLQARQEERTEQPAAAAVMLAEGIPVTLLSDRISQGNIFTLNGLLLDLMAAQPEWAKVQEAARELISTSGTSDPVESQRAKTGALVNFLQNAARFEGPADVLELITRIQRGDPVLNVRKYAGVLMAAAEKKRATHHRVSVEALAAETVRTEPEAAALQAPPAPDTTTRDVRVERDGSGEDKQRNEGRQDNQGDHERDESDGEPHPAETAEERGTPDQTLSERFSALRGLMDRLCAENTIKLGNHSAAAHKSNQSRALKSIESANIPEAQKFFLLEQFEQNLGTEGGLERVRLLREKIESRPETVKALDALSRRTTWAFAYRITNQVYHKILLLEPEAYEAAMTRFHSLVSNLKSPSSTSGFGKMNLFHAMRRLDRDLDTMRPQEVRESAQTVREALLAADIEAPAAPAEVLPATDLADTAPVAANVAAAEVDAPEAGEATIKISTRAANRQIIANLPESLRAQAEEILNLIDRTYEIENVRKNPALIVEAGIALPELEGKLRFAIGRRKGRVDLNVKYSLEACEGLPELAARIILEKQREVIEGTLEISDFTRKIRDRILHSKALNAQVKSFEERATENTAEWGLASTRLGQVYRRLILESEKAHFDSSRERLVRRLEALQSGSVSEIAQALQELCDAENIDHVLRGAPVGGRADVVEVIPESIPSAIAPVMDVGPTAEEVAAEPAPHDASPAPASEAVETHAPVEAPREVRSLSADHRSLCERLSRPYNQTLPNELEKLLNTGETWATVFAISIRIVERITSGEEIALAPHVAASRLFLSLRKRTRSTPEGIQVELKNLEKDLTPPSDPEGSGGGSDTPPSPPPGDTPPSPPPAETLVEREETQSERDVPPIAVEELTPTAEVVTPEAPEATATPLVEVLDEIPPAAPKVVVDATPLVEVLDKTPAAAPVHPIVEIVEEAPAAPEVVADATPLVEVLDETPAATPTKASPEVVSEVVVAQQSSPEEIYILSNMSFNTQGRAAYDRFSDKARAGLAKILLDCRDPNRRRIIEALFTNVNAQDLREGNFLCRLFECLADCYQSKKVNRIYEAFIPKGNIDRALRDPLFQKRILKSILTEYEIVVRYISRADIKYINLSERYPIAWSALTPVQRDYIQNRIDNSQNFTGVESEAIPDFRVTKQDGSSYLVEVKEVYGSDFSPGEEPLIRILKQAFRYAIVRNTRTDQKIGHAEFVIRADTIEGDFIVIFRETCETAQIPFILCKYTAEGKLEVVDASPGLNLNHFENGRTFAEARRAQTQPATARASEPPPGARVSTPPEAIREETDADLEASEDSKIQITPAMARFFNSLIDRNFYPEGNPSLNAKNDFLSNFKVFRKASRSQSIESIDRELGNFMKSDEFRDLPGVVRERILSLKDEINRTSKTGTHNVSQRFFKQLLEIASLVTDPSSFLSDPANARIAARKKALEVILLNPSSVSDELERMQQDLKAFQDYQEHLTLNDLEECSPDRPFGLNVIGEGITLRELYQEIENNGALKGVIGVSVCNSILEYINQYDRLHTQLSSRAQRPNATQNNAEA